MSQNLKRRWNVLNDGTLMWFKGKQDFIHSGWMTKMGGGTTTLGTSLPAPHIPHPSPLAVHRRPQELEASVLCAQGRRACVQPLGRGGR
jgi:hypothetical protein